MPSPTSPLSSAPPHRVTPSWPAYSLCLRLPALLLLLGALLGAGPLLADGKVFATTRAVLVRTDTPDQQALIHFSNGVERLVIQTAFRGVGTNFAWVVPLPAPPQIEAVPDGLFPTLEFIFQPRLTLQVRPYWIWLTATVACGLVVVWLPRAWLWLTLSTLLALAMLLPALGPASTKASAGSSGQVALRILQHQQVGLYETTTLRAADPRALFRWFATHGFALPTNAVPVLEGYIRSGWCFAAARVNRPADSVAPHRIHPLAFTFPTPEAIYPLQLTGLDNGPCRIDLYVFGPGRASTAGFTVRTCDLPAPTSTNTTPALRTDRGLILADHLTRWTGTGPVATHLTGTLRPKHITRDARIHWEPFRPSRPRLYTHAAALHLVLNLAVPALLGLLVWAVCAATRKPPCRRSLLTWLGSILGLALVVYAALPKVPTPSLRRFQIKGFTPNIVRHASLGIALYLRDDWDYARAHGRTTVFSQAEVENQVRSLLASPTNPPWHPLHYLPPFNLITGGPLQLQSSPGNFSIRCTADGYDLLWHDAYGNAGEVTPLGRP